jgi:hypothetical protein
VKQSWSNRLGLEGYIFHELIQIDPNIAHPTKITWRRQQRPIGSDVPNNFGVEICPCSFYFHVPSLHLNALEGDTNVSIYLIDILYIDAISMQLNFCNDHGLLILFFLPTDTKKTFSVTMFWVRSGAGNRHILCKLSSST